MPDIFISYAREDIGSAKQLADALDSQGWSVFWDRTIPAGQSWRSYVGKALDEAGCVIVIWSKSSIESEWVYEEAGYGKRRGILVPVRFDAVLPPIGFSEIQAADLCGWTGSTTANSFRKLLEPVTTLLGRPPHLLLEERQRQEKQEAKRKADEEERKQQAAKATQKKRSLDVQRELEKQAEAEQAEEERKRRQAVAAKRRKAKEDVEKQRHYEDVEQGSTEARVEPTQSSSRQARIWGAAIGIFVGTVAFVMGADAQRIEDYAWVLVPGIGGYISVAIAGNRRPVLIASLVGAVLSALIYFLFYYFTSPPFDRDTGYWLASISLLLAAPVGAVLGSAIASRFLRTDHASE